MSGLGGESKILEEGLNNEYGPETLDDWIINSSADNFAEKMAEMVIVHDTELDRLIAFQNVCMVKSAIEKTKSLSDPFKHEDNDVIRKLFEAYVVMIKECLK
ncbi:hypothetical protein CSB37_01025 [bacterium DOLZORAL124_38_8]|nr:MAG: hypothetical protein CSB37_01025 [bacterium DOLZORAL124_38_8]